MGYDVWPLSQALTLINLYQLHLFFFFSSLKTASKYLFVFFFSAIFSELHFNSSIIVTALS